jgi:uncharacterized protein YecT (DUF1311 family)
MSRLLLTLALLFSFSLPIFAQKCGFDGPEDAQQTEKLLRDAPSCAAAAKIFDACRWGSSMDGYFGSLVVTKCEAEMPKIITQQEKKHLDYERQLCSAEFSGADRGTIVISESASCNVDAVSSFVDNPHKFDTAPPRASFDCVKAQTPYERAVCDHPDLGMDDIIMSRAYRPFVNALKPKEKQQLIASQRVWSKQLAASCQLFSVLASASSLACLRRELEQRFANSKTAQMAWMSSVSTRRTLHSSSEKENGRPKAGRFLL